MMAKKRGTEKKLGIKEVAEVAGVSPTTVSRVLNDRGYISDETRKKVYTAMDQIGYYPNEIARALLIQRTYFVGVIVPSIVDRQISPKIIIRCFYVIAKIMKIQNGTISEC